MVGRAVWLAVSLSLWGAGAARAADPPNVVPGDEGMGKPRHTGPGYLTWVGFEKRDPGVRVFVRLSSPPGASIGQARAGGELVVTLPGYRLDTKNDGRALDTRYFGTNVLRVVAVPVKTGVELHIKTKTAAPEAQVSTGQTPDGQTLINFDL
jgi:hypothetical protein